MLDNLPPTLEINYPSSGREEEYNRKLSEDRAQAVRDFLVKSGVGPSVIVGIRGRGEDQPLASNDDDEGRQRNRRVEIIVDQGMATAQPAE